MRLLSVTGAAKGLFTNLFIKAIIIDRQDMHPTSSAAKSGAGQSNLLRVRPPAASFYPLLGILPFYLVVHLFFVFVHESEAGGPAGHTLFVKRGSSQSKAA